MSEKRAISIWLAPGASAPSMWNSTMYSVTDESSGASSSSTQARRNLCVRPIDRPSGTATSPFCTWPTLTQSRSRVNDSQKNRSPAPERDRWAPTGPYGHADAHRLADQELLEAEADVDVDGPPRGDRVDDRPVGDGEAQHVAARPEPGRVE